MCQTATEKRVHDQEEAEVRVRVCVCVCMWFGGGRRSSKLDRLAWLWLGSGAGKQPAPPKRVQWVPCVESCGGPDLRITWAEARPARAWEGTAIGALAVSGRPQGQH